jgi:Replication protein A interacting C-terminal
VSDARRRAAVLREWRSEEDAEELDSDRDGCHFRREDDCRAEHRPRRARGHTAGTDDDLSLSEGELDALVADLEAAIESERRKEEEEILVAAANELYVTSQADDDADVDELARFQSQLDLDTAQPFVLCPICERNRLFVRHGTVFCACGLRIIGGTTDNITLDMVRSRLAGVLDEHFSRGCRQKPMFSQRDVLSMGFTFLHVNCPRCEWDAIAF